MLVQNILPIYNEKLFVLLDAYFCWYLSALGKSAEIHDSVWWCTFVPTENYVAHFFHGSYLTNHIWSWSVIRNFTLATKKMHRWSEEIWVMIFYGITLNQRVRCNQKDSEKAVGILNSTSPLQGQKNLSRLDEKNALWYGITQTGCRIKKAVFSMKDSRP